MLKTQYLEAVILEILFQYQKKSIKLINKINKSRNTRICLHKANNSSLHVMLIKFFKSKNNKLHYHKNKCEFYFVLNGKLNIKIKK